MRYKTGYSLTEILVTLAIVSFGLLGIAGIVANSLKSNQNSYARTRASMLANDIIDRMRANRTTAENTSSPYNLALDASNPTGSTVPETDLSQWRTELATTLPEGKGSVAMNKDTKKVTVVVKWMQRKIESGQSTTFGSEEQEIIVETRL